MIRCSTLSYGQVYRLFGYRKALDIDTIIDELFYAISVMEISQINYASMDTSDLFTSNAMYSFHPVFKKEYLEEYLAHKTSRMFLYRLEARMRVIYMKKAEIKQIKWYHLFKLSKLHLELFRLSSSKIQIEDAFAFLAYKAQKMGISTEKIHELMKNKAKNYSVSKRKLLY